MAYSYANWIEQATDAARVTALRSHIAEVSAEIAAAVSKDGASRNTADLRQYRADLMNDLRDYERRAARASGSSVTLVKRRQA